MDLTREPRYLMVRARGEVSPLYVAEEEGPAAVSGFTRALALGDPVLGLPEQLAHELASWAQARPTAGFDSHSQLRGQTRQGVEIAQRLAKHLGPGWVLRYWDESHQTAKFVCWGCSRLHWALEEHGNTLHPLHITVQGEYRWYPLRAEGFGDFAPDDPAAGLDLSDELVADLYAWSADFDAGMDLYLRDRDEARDDARRVELELRGQRLTARLADEIGSGRTVTYNGLG
ncbi:hypothetical protein [Streptomyces sp. NPDC023838]|uniref:hypothetical protein n=1 Tax=Streptomyces sp. NPDC023838 TaxID=3154325 RepID=UPI0033F36F72